MDNIWSVLYVVEKWHLIFECVKFYFWRKKKKKKSRERILTPPSHVALCVQEQLTTLNWNNPRLMLALTWYSASCCICMCVFVVYYGFSLVLRMWSVLSVLVIISVFSTTLALVLYTLPCVGFCRVKCHLPCISCRSEHFCFGYSKTNRRSFGGVGGYLSSQL